MALLALSFPFLTEPHVTVPKNSRTVKSSNGNATARKCQSGTGSLSGVMFIENREVTKLRGMKMKASTPSFPARSAS